jgi:hypothetical protein
VSGSIEFGELSVLGIRREEVRKWGPEYEMLLRNAVF